MKAGKISDIKGIGVLKSMSLKNTFATYLIISILVLAILFFGLYLFSPMLQKDYTGFGEPSSATGKMNTNVYRQEDKISYRNAILTMNRVYLIKYSAIMEIECSEDSYEFNSEQFMLEINEPDSMVSSKQSPSNMECVKQEDTGKYLIRLMFDRYNEDFLYALRITDDENNENIQIVINDIELEDV